VGVDAVGASLVAVGAGCVEVVVPSTGGGAGVVVVSASLARLLAGRLSATVPRTSRRVRRSRGARGVIVSTQLPRR
jgi:hypothetical protein